ncbi:PAS domain-containing sensor histidine kinase [Pseudomarimonas arenosa]|uniref:histidine kinase n=1 Tax=Pseudomarimonas arenosa TaxID=2774145 RepID=A0AAW3ZPW8_9GAMM|nr:PAS domain S-box protein [Pseudomarimonas arenosa]MBD8527768.1 PAS domain S-box protein [Pseudomarimonas arenosa]
MQDRLHDLINQESPDAVIATDADGLICFWSRGAERMLGFAESESLGCALSQLVVPPERQDEEQRMRAQALSSGKVVYESMRRRKDGVLLYADISARRVESADRGVVIVYAKKDVTELKVRRDAKHLRSSFGELLDSTPDGILLVNPTGRIVLANRQATQIFGYENDGLIGLAVEQLLPERLRGGHVSHRASYVAQPRVRAMGAGLDLYGRRKNGDEFPVEISLSPLQTDEGTLIFSAIRDSSDRKRIETELRDTNAQLERANAAKDLFLAGMSHELRTPLNAIIGFTGTLLMKLPGPLTLDQERHLQTVKASSKHLLSLINDLLDLAKIDAGKTEVNNQRLRTSELLDEVVEAVRLSAERKGLSLHVDYQAAPIEFVSDPRLLRQILFNLSSNAIKFTDQGSITLRVWRRVQDAASAIVLSVIDTGMGIRDEDQQHLFEAFTRLRSRGDDQREGTGLGLHLTQKLVGLLGGQIELESSFGRGSEFRVVLPETDG